VGTIPPSSKGAITLSELSGKYKSIKDQLEETRSRFCRLLADIPDSDLDRPLVGGLWTIKQEMVHIVQALEVLPTGIERARVGSKRSLLGSIPSGLRNWVNGHIIIPWKAKYQTRETIANAYQDAHQIMLLSLENLTRDDWGKGMPYPRVYRTVEQMAQRPIEHFEEHEAHIRLLLKKPKGS